MYNAVTPITERDLDFLVQAVADRRNDPAKVKEIIRDKEDLIEIMLNDAKLFRKLLEKREELLCISPYFLFNILLRQVRRDLEHASYMYEGYGRMRLPVFDAPKVKKALEDNAVISYLADLLSSFTRVQTYVLVYSIGSRVHRRTLSSMELDDLLFLSSVVDERYRFEIHRRIGDLALFMAGMFPEHVDSSSWHIRRARRLGKWERGLEDYLEIGRHYYDLASQHLYASEFGLSEILRFLSENIALLRRALNVLSDKYVGTSRNLWFGVDR
ncbi:MAG: hypothetical protein ACPLQP_09975 [Moorellaceae bacterium]